MYKDPSQGEESNYMPNKRIEIAPYRARQGKILEIKKLPTLPNIAYRLLDLLSQKDPDLKELEDTIRYDQAITAKVLAVANSAFFGLQKEISTLDRAIVALGAREVGEIAFSVCVLSVFRPIRSIKDFDIRKFWIHCIGTAITARIIAQTLEFCDEEKFFSWGLLHDIGRLVLLFSFPKEFEEILEIRAQEDKPLLSVEKDFGLAHTWIGRWLLKRWGLPETFAQVAQFHHTPFHQGKIIKKAALIKIADLLTHQMDLALLPVGPLEEIKPLLKRLHISEEDYQNILEHLMVIKDTIKSWEGII